MARSQSPYLLFSWQSVPKTEIDTGVPHRHTVKSLLKENKEPFHKEASGAFFRFLKDHGVAVLVAHNGKRYVRSFLRFALVGGDACILLCMHLQQDHRILAFHGFKPPAGTRAADSIVSRVPPTKGCACLC